MLSGIESAAAVWVFRPRHASGLNWTGLGGTSGSVPWNIVVLLSLLTLLPALLVALTPFTRLLIVFHFLRQALGTQTAPSNQTLIGLALVLTYFLMQPVAAAIYQAAVVPYQRGQVDAMGAVELGSPPLRHFMLKYAREKDLALFLELAQALHHGLPGGLGRDAAERRGVDLLLHELADHSARLHGLGLLDVDLGLRVADRVHDLHQGPGVQLAILRVDVDLELLTGVNPLLGSGFERIRNRRDHVRAWNALLFLHVLKDGKNFAAHKVGIVGKKKRAPGPTLDKSECYNELLQYPAAANLVKPTALALPRHFQVRRRPRRPSTPEDCNRA